jgi:hypothetical protein
VRRVAGTRHDHPDLLGWASGDDPSDDRSATFLVDPAAQMVELADLVARGLVSPEELERQRRKVFGA